ncbi:MAG: histidine triad nucleotide-binding protein [Pseudomonadota bacterium]
MPTIFERIMAGEIPADIVYQNDHAVAFRDINPQAPTHLLVVPRAPIADLEAAGADDTLLLGRVIEAARAAAAALGLTAGGYRLVLNNGRDAGQEVPHLHVHLLAGRRLGWPPG